MPAALELTLTRVLVAAGDPVARKLLRTLLDLREYDLLEARDGLQAAALLERARPRVAVLDAALPRLDAVGACRALRADPERAGTHARTKLVILADRDHPGRRHPGTFAFADAYLVKPYSPLALLDVVQRLIRG